VRVPPLAGLSIGTKARGVNKGAPMNSDFVARLNDDPQFKELVAKAAPSDTPRGHSRGRDKL
jgi:hypothetical protein